MKIPEIVWLPLGMLALFALVDIAWRKYDKQKSEIDLEERLMKRWKAARKARHAWECRHSSNPSLFYDKEYQRLWRAETDAESLLLHKLRKNKVLETTSFVEYSCRKNEVQHKV